MDIEMGVKVVYWY